MRVFCHIGHIGFFLCTLDLFGRMLIFSHPNGAENEILPCADMQELVINEVTRPEKSLQLLLLILLFIYKVNISPDMRLQLLFYWVVVFPDSFHLNRFFCMMNLVRCIVADAHVRSFTVVKLDCFMQVSNCFFHCFDLLPI